MRKGLLPWALVLLAVTGCEEQARRSVSLPPRVQRSPPVSDADAFFVQLSEEPQGRLAPVVLTIYGRNASVVGVAGCREHGLQTAWELSRKQAAEVRSAVLLTGFLDDWSEHPSPTGRSAFTVEVGLGERRLSRTFVSSPQWDTAAQVLHPLMADVEALHQLEAHGDLRLAESALQRTHPRPTWLPRAAFIAPLREFTRTTTQRYRLLHALELLTTIDEPASWQAHMTSLIETAEGERRQTLLGFLGKSCSPDSDLRRCQRGLLPLALSEARLLLHGASVDDDLTWQRLRGPRHLLAVERYPPAIPLWTELIRTAQRPHPSVGLAWAGEPGVDPLLALLSDERALVRTAAVQTANLMAGVFDGPPTELRLDQDALSAARQRFEADIVPVLTRMMRDPDEAGATRAHAQNALAQLGLVESRAAEKERLSEEAAARRLAEEARREEERVARTPPRPPKGDLAVTGFARWASGKPIDGFHVRAERQDGNAYQPWRTYGYTQTASDGSFRIEELPPGPYEIVVDLQPIGSARDLAGLGIANRVEGVRAGGDGVDIVVDLGACIRGRLLRSDGEPVARRRIVFQMRDVPMQVPADVQFAGAVDTDPEGRFWIVRLMDGRYDLQLVPPDPLEGGEDIRPGVEELTLRLVAPQPISGRIVDDRGVPVKRMRVIAYDPNDDDIPRLRTSTNRRGEFLLRGGRPEHAYRVVMSTGAAGEFDLLAERLVSGTRGVELYADTRPRLIGSVIHPLSGRSPNVSVRLSHERGRVVTYDYPQFELLRAPEGVWKVEARVRRRDADGKVERVWVEIGEMRTGAENPPLPIPEWAE